MEYLSLKQTAEKWGISVRRVQTLCSSERIIGAVKIGSYWAIPADAEKPKDERIRLDVEECEEEYATAIRAMTKGLLC